jgi:hypothetical protein
MWKIFIPPRFGGWMGVGGATGSEQKKQNECMFHVVDVFCRDPRPRDSWREIKWSVLFILVYLDKVKHK